MPTSAAALKAYFNTGDKPTQTHFEELIDGSLNLNDGGSVTGEVKLKGNIGLTPGDSISDHVGLYKSWISHEGSVTTTNILIDLTGLRSTAGGDVIGNDGDGDPAHIGQYTTAKMGTLFAVHMHCLEQPAGGADDIDLCFNDSVALEEDDAISGGSNSGTLLNNGTFTAGFHGWTITGFPAANQYLFSCR